MVTGDCIHGHMHILPKTCDVPRVTVTWNGYTGRGVRIRMYSKYETLRPGYIGAWGAHTSASGRRSRTRRADMPDYADCSTNIIPWKERRGAPVALR